MSTSLSLFRLQQIDNHIKKTISRLTSINLILDHNDALQTAEVNLQKVQSDYIQTKRLLKNIETEDSNLRIKLEMVESSLYSGKIKNPKELQDLQKEITSHKKNMSSLEDRQLELMMMLESFEDEIEHKNIDLEKTRGQVTGENAKLMGERITLTNEMESLTQQRTAVLSGIEAKFLDIYESLRNQRSGIAVAEVLENSCTVCGSSLTPGLAQSVRTSTFLVFCPMCGRILYSN